MSTVEISPELTAKLAAERSRHFTIGGNTPSNLTVGDVVQLHAAYHYAVLALKEMTAKAEKHERREDQFRTWWTGVKQELDQLKRSLLAEAGDR